MYGPRRCTGKPMTHERRREEEEALVGTLKQR